MNAQENLLIAEDDPQWLDLIDDSLYYANGGGSKIVGYKLVSTPAEALAELATGCFSFLVSDGTGWDEVIKQGECTCRYVSILTGDPASFRQYESDRVAVWDKINGPNDCLRDMLSRMTKA